MNMRLDELIEAWRDGALSETAARELSALLRDDVEARRTFRAEARLHGLLHSAAATAAIEALTDDAAESIAESQSFSLTARPRRRTFQAAAAGLVIGICCTSLAWAIASPRLRPADEITSLLFDEDFSNATTPRRGFPTAYDSWGGDPAVIADRNGGGNALRFVQAETDPNAPGGRAHWCDIFRIVDLRSLRKLPHEDSVLELEARFFADRETEPHYFCARLFAFAGDPSTIGTRWPSAMQDASAIGAVQVRSDEAKANGRQPLAARTKIVVPAAADFAVIQLTVTPAQTPAPEAAVAFAAHYADDVRLTLHQRPKP